MKDRRKYWAEQAKYGRDRSVIDPNDRMGYKNRYIISLRDRAILNALSNVPRDAKVLDFGCGSGNLSRALAKHGYRSAGVDISFDMLRYTRGTGQNSLFVQYDGEHLPFPSDCFGACVTFWVLNYLVDTDLFCRVLKEIHRVLKPGGRLIAIEQTSRKNRFKPDEMKLQRSANEFLQLFTETGFHVRESRIIRRGHFPLIYAIRCGLVPGLFFPYMGRAEEILGKVFKRVRFDYADTMFIAEKGA